jgi:hypothetical protein
LEYFSYARNSGQLDFAALTDHAEALDDSKYDQIKSAANASNVDGTFVAFYGFEWSSSALYGDVGIINADTYVDSNNPDTDTIPELFNWLSTQDAIAMLHHPGREDDVGQEFTHFTADYCPKVVGIELFNKNDLFNVYYYNDGYYVDNKTYLNEAADISAGRNWLIGAGGGLDVHDNTWAGVWNSRLAVLATAKTRSAIFEALQNKRFYSTLDKNLRVYFTANGSPMGSSVEAGMVMFSMEAWDDDDESITELYLIKNGTTFESVSGPASHMAWTTGKISLSGEHWYLLVREQDGDEAVTSPIFVK